MEDSSKDLAKFTKWVTEKFYNDPSGYCCAILGFEPDPWQDAVLESVTHNRRTAVRSGHGVGKSRLASAVIHWFCATRAYPQIVCTANTLTQLKDKLWRELAVVHSSALNKDFFEHSATKFALKAAADRWFASAVPWSKENPEAFAGTHAENVLLIFDESSAIEPIIWDTASGAMTTKGARWLVLGNPTRNTGKFHECFGRNRFVDGDSEDEGKWHCFTVSCLDSPRVEQAYIEEQKREYGEDSDFYRVRVLGLPPVQEEQQFIGNDLFDAAVHRGVIESQEAAKILGVDVAWYGDDKTVICERRGAVIRKILVRRGQDTMRTVGDIVEIVNQAKANNDPYHHIVVDAVGIGAGVVDRLKELRMNVIPLNSGAASRKPEKYKNLRAELWDAYREWLKTGHIDEDFRDDSTGISYGFDSGGRLQMERKIDMKKRGLSSPDFGDCATFCLFPASAHLSTPRTSRTNMKRMKYVSSGESWQAAIGFR